MSVYTIGGREIFAVYDIEQAGLEQAYDIDQYPLLEKGGEYGVEWDYSQPSPALTRTGDAAGFADPVPATTLAEVGSSPFDNVMPWAGMKMCNIINGEVVYWQGDPQFSETDYDTMVYIPEFWYKAEKHTDTHKWNWSISPTEKEGYAKHPGSGRYVGRYHSSGSNQLFSVGDAMPRSGDISRADARTKSHAKGEHWWQYDLATWAAIQVLFLIEFATFDTMASIGEGATTLTATGATDGAVYGTLKNQSGSNTYRWIENPCSNTGTFVDGILISSMTVYASTDPANYSDSTSSMTATGVTLPSGSGGVWILDYGYSSVFPWAFIPSKTGRGSRSTYATSQMWTNTGLRSAVSLNTFWECGMGYSTNSASSNVGCRLIFIP